MINFKSLRLFSVIIFSSFIHTELVSIPAGCTRKCGSPLEINFNGYPHIIVVVLGLFVVAPVVVIAWIAWEERKKKLQQLREDQFDHNGGNLLKRKLSRRRNTQLSTYSVQDMNSITNNYSSTSTAHPMPTCCTQAFYHGTLPSSGHEVSVLKIQKVPRPQIERFVDQLIHLSQPHPHKVRLIGCCLETNCPLLVYDLHGGEAASTLLHCTRYGPLTSRFSCEKRVKAAAGVARGLASLAPIVHGNICSDTIVVDTASFHAKLYYAAGSNLIPPPGTEEYRNTKSDVYSFGVVLVELLTGGRTFSPDRDMASEFVRLCRAGHLREILDEVMTAESDAKIVSEVAILAEKCLNVTPRKRPNIKKVKTKLTKLILQRGWNNDI